MTLTAPIPVVRQNAVQPTLGDRIRAGEVPVIHEAHLHPSLLLTPVDRKGVHHTVDVGAWRAQLELAQQTVRTAIDRTLTAAGVAPADGWIRFDLQSLDRYVALIGTWRPL